MAKTQVKRSFGFDTTSLATAAPLLSDGVYAGVITNATVVGKENKQYITIAKELKWDKVSKKMEETGEYIMQGFIIYSTVLTSKKAIKALQVDEPRVFGGVIRLDFDKETFVLKPNHVLGQFLTALDLQDIPFTDSVDWEYDENVEIPLEFTKVPKIVDMLNSINYQRALFTLIANAANNRLARVNVLKRPNRQTPEIMENVINLGTFSAPFCGILHYVENSEHDLDV